MDHSKYGLGLLGLPGVFSALRAVERDQTSPLTASPEHSRDEISILGRDLNLSVSPSSCRQEAGKYLNWNLKDHFFPLARLKIFSPLKVIFQ